jgi:hypothetical protein
MYYFAIPDYYIGIFGFHNASSLDILIIAILGWNISDICHYYIVIL